ncbi:MAG: hypothetical protein AAF941_03270 [Pseudomonadota bacterium]
MSHLAFLSIAADRWLIRPDDGAPPAFFTLPHNAVARAGAAHIPVLAVIARLVTDE